MGGQRTKAGCEGGGSVVDESGRVEGGGECGRRYGMDKGWVVRLMGL